MADDLAESRGLSVAALFEGKTLLKGFMKLGAYYRRIRTNKIVLES